MLSLSEYLFNNMGFGWSRAEHQYSVPVEGTEKEGESPIFRNPQSP